MVILAVVGRLASGKKTLANYLVKRSFYHVRLDGLAKNVEELREKYGGYILAQLAIEKANREAFGQHVVVTGITSEYEISFLEKQKKFILVSVEADEKVRYERYKKAHGEIALEDFRKIDKVNDALIKKASVTIENNSTTEEFYARIHEFLKRFMPLLDKKRAGWHEYFMEIAKEVATRSNCIKRKVGCVIVKERRIISTGYNGTPRGVKNCNEGGCSVCNEWVESGTKKDKCSCSHAEENAIVQAAYHGISTKGATLYVTFSPCLMCAKMIINAGIKEVYYNASYPLAENAKALLKEAGVKIRMLKV